MARAMPRPRRGGPTEGDARTSRISGFRRAKAADLYVNLVEGRKRPRHLCAAVPHLYSPFDCPCFRCCCCQLRRSPGTAPAIAVCCSCGNTCQVEIPAKWQTGRYSQSESSGTEGLGSGPVWERVARQGQMETHGRSSAQGGVSIRRRRRRGISNKRTIDSNKLASRTRMAGGTPAATAPRALRARARLPGR
jgi:hypothetical protein